MLVHPPRERLCRRKFWNLKGISRLAVRRQMYFVRLLVIDTDAHNMKFHNRTQLAREKPEEFFRRAN
jgi:hypothetical protein